MEKGKKLVSFHPQNKADMPISSERKSGFGLSKWERNYLKCRFKAHRNKVNNFDMRQLLFQLIKSCHFKYLGRSSRAGNWFKCSNQPSPCSIQGEKSFNGAKTASSYHARKSTYPQQDCWNNELWWIPFSKSSFQQ